MNERIFSLLIYTKVKLSQSRDRNIVISGDKNESVKFMILINYLFLFQRNIF